MNYLSVCSGIEAATVAWHPLGWRAAAYSEIEQFPCETLAHHYPTVPNYGDMTRFQEWPDANISLLVGGTPCQAFSVAGLRKGLADPRGNLTLTFLAIAARHRPAWVVWENVPGVLSDATGAFGALLGGLAELGYGWAYRVLDAQYYGVAQRRRRVFVVGSAGDWRRAAAVLFERESLSGNPAPRRQSGERPAPSIAARTRGGGGLGTDAELDGALIAHSLKADGFDASEDGTGRGTPLVPEVVGCLSDGAHNGGGLNGQDAYSGRIFPVASREIAGAVTSNYGKQADSSDSALGPSLAIAFANTAGDTNLGMSKEGVPPLTRRNGDPGNVLIPGMRVRRLTPRECERLQGFPDDYTLIPRKGGKLAADGPRYKALGNSMAVPVMAWIGRRIEAVSQQFAGRDGA